MELQDLLSVETKLSSKELKQISGGVSLSSSIVNAFSAAFKTVYGFGQEFGGATRRIVTRKTCKL